LFFHKTSKIEDSASETCDQFKYEISTFEKGGYHPYKFIPYLETAIVNAKNADNHPDYYNPNYKSTKVYLLAETLLAKIGVNDFSNFISKSLPLLIKADIDRMKALRKRTRR